MLQANDAGAGGVLIVDDNPAFLAQVRDFLLRSRLVTPVDTAASGQEALARLAGRPYRLVVTDLFMPGIDGVELARRVRALPNPPEVALVSLFETADFRDAALEAGATAFLSKRRLADDLLDLVRRMFRGEGP